MTEVTLALPSSVSRRFQVLFHSPHRGSFHLSLTVLVRYRSTKVFSLGGWTPQFPTGLACPVVLRIPAAFPPFAYGTITPFRWPFQNHSARSVSALCWSYNPDSRNCRFGLFHFRSPLLAELFLFLRVLRCFSSPGSLTLRCNLLFAGWVSPFGDRWINTCTRLPSAFRSVPRPSSAFVAKASPVRLLLLLLSCGEHAFFTS